ncbi:hypothetical protein FRB90_000506 [Tulasnella sp. 427]|nr:hypothetical protein FRB90_000506 [Tulasnella sp. 427]
MQDSPIQVPASQSGLHKQRIQALGECRAKQRLSDEPPQPQYVPKASQGNAEEVQVIKLSARGVLATLSEKRLSITDINFLRTENEDLRGGYADVQMGEITRLRTGGKLRTVAVKKVRFDSQTDQSRNWDAEEQFLRLFANELRILNGLSHPNIVEILGFVEDMNSAIAWLVFPWEENGNLHEFLQAGTWDISERIQEVAHGLEYLHTRNPPICHCDLKSLNILINAWHSAVITDFGSARLLRETEGNQSKVARGTAHASNQEGISDVDIQSSEIAIQTSASFFTLTGPGYSIRWAPPEALMGGPPSLATDIWALGWIGWGAITGRYPFDEIERNEKVTITIARGQMPQIYDNGELAQIGHLCDLMLKCWRSCPEKRPSARECMLELNTLPRAIPGSKNEVATSKTRSAALLLQNGEVLRAAGKPEKALKLFDEVLATSRAVGDTTLEVAALNAQADIHLAMFKYSDAERCLIKVREIYRSIKDGIREAATLKDLGDLRLAGFKYAEAEQSYVRALNIYAKEVTAKDVPTHSERPPCTRSESVEEENPQMHRRDVDRLWEANVKRGLGDAYLARSELTKAETTLISALETFRSLENPSEEAEVLKILGDVHLARSDYTRAQEYYSQALPIFRSNRLTSGETSIMNSLGDVQLARLKYKEAREIYIQVYKAVTDAENDRGQANVLRSWGDLHLAESKSTKAEGAYLRGLTVFRKIGDRLGEARVLNGLGDVYRTQSQHNNAEETYNQALQLFRAVGNKIGEASALKGLGAVYMTRSEHLREEETYLSALKVLKGVGSRSTEASVLTAVASAYDRRSYLPKSEEAYKQALTLLNSIGHLSEETSVLTVLAGVYARRSNFPKSEEAYNQALRLLKVLGNLSEEANVLKRCGDMYLEWANAKAEDRYHEALEAFRGVEDRSGEEIVLKALGAFYLKRLKSSGEEVPLGFLQSLRDWGNRRLEATVLVGLGDYHRYNSSPRAREAYLQALEAFQEVGDEFEEFEVRDKLLDIGIIYR